MNNFISHSNAKRLHGVSVGVVVGTDHFVEVVDHILLEVHHIQQYLNYRITTFNLQYMSDDDEFDDYESASEHHHNILAEKIVEHKAEPFDGIGLLDNYSEPINTLPLQQFFSLDSNPISSSPLDFSQLLKNQAIDPYLAKKDNSREINDEPYLIGFHKHSSELQPANLSNLTYEFTSFIGGSNPAQNDFSLSSPGGQDSVNYWDSSKEVGQIVEGNIILQNQFQKQKIAGNSETQTNTFGDMKLFDYQKAMTAKIVDNYQIEKITMDISKSELDSFHLSDSVENPLTVLPDYKKVEDNILVSNINFSDILVSQITDSKQRSESDEFEYVSTQNTISSHLQVQELPSIAISNYIVSNDEPQIWPEYLQKTMEIGENNQLLLSREQPAQIVEDKLEVNDQKITLPSLQTNIMSFNIDESTVSKQGHQDEDEFVFGNHSEQQQEFVFQEVSNQTAHLSSQPQQQDEFGEFSETHSHQLHNQGQQTHNIVNSDNVVKIQAQYVQSGSSAFYLSKQKQLQAFINSLPDYSRLLAQAQHS